MYSRNIKYRAVKDQRTGTWLVEQVEQFFNLPIVVAEFMAQKSARIYVKSLQYSQKQ